MRDSSVQGPSSTFVGIVTVLYCSDDVLEGFFASLSLQRDVAFRVYVVDNSSTDSGTRLAQALANQYGLDVECLFNKANLGVAAGNNQGIRLAQRDGCSHVLLANNDVEFAAGTVSGLLRSLREEGVMAVSPKIYYFGTARMIWYAGGGMDSWTVKTPHYGFEQQDVGQYDRAGDTVYAPTCFMLTTMAAFTHVGMMDERYFCYYDDADFVWRLWRNGGRLRYEPACMVEHKVSSSTGGGMSPFTVYYMNRNRVYFARKNLRGLQRIIALTYMTLTRIRATMHLDRALARRMWAGVKDGWRLPTGDA